MGGTEGAAVSSLPEIPPGASFEAQQKESTRKSGVALVDELALRRASTLTLLRAHIRVHARPYRAAAELLDQVRSNRDKPRCVIVCVGSLSVTASPSADQVGRLCSDLTPIPVIVLSNRDEPREVGAAFRLGARGYIPTGLEPTLVATAIRMVLAGGAFVPASALMRAPNQLVIDTPPPAACEPDGAVCAQQEFQELRGNWPPPQSAVLSALVEGKSNKEIARALAMEESTVKVHVRQIMRKLGVTNRTEAALCGRRLRVRNGSDEVIST